MEISTGLGLENYTPEGVEKAVGNYWNCVKVLEKKRRRTSLSSVARRFQECWDGRGLSKSLRQTKEKTGIPADAPLGSPHCGHAPPRAQDLDDR